MTDSQEKQRASYGDLARIVGANLDADVWFYAGPLVKPGQESVMKVCSRHEKRRNAFLVLATYGGSPHVAYRIGRCLQNNYEKVIVCIDGPAMSAGTLLALAAHELVISDTGTLGPLDIQIPKEDELFQSTSGLAVSEAVSALMSEASSSFDMTLLDLKFKSGGRITLRTAMETASNLTAQLFQPLFGQIDPVRLAEDARSMQMVQEYGERLARRSGNLQSEAVSDLVAGYPSHDFEIDRNEADETLFRNVRAPHQRELALLETLRDASDTSVEELLVLRLWPPTGEEREERNETERFTSQGSNRTDEESQGTPQGSASGNGRISPGNQTETDDSQTNKVH